MGEVDPVTVRDSKVTSRGYFSQNGAIQVLDSVDNQIVANSFKSHPVRVSGTIHLAESSEGAGPNPHSEKSKSFSLFV
jgi:hypothetical protein